MTLSQRIRGRSARIGVLGLGYVGLPLAMEFCRKGFRVTGFEVDRHRLDALARGRSYIGDVSAAELRRWRTAGRFSSTDRLALLPDQDAVLVCVQTPLRKTKKPDLSRILAALKEVSRRLRPGQLIVIESTTYPGATEEVILPVLRRSGLRLGKDFFLAFSPERVDPGNPVWSIANTPKVVGGADPASTRLAARLYARVVDRVVPVSSTRAAETVKLLENTFRAVNIALVNEMAQVCRHLGLDVWEVIEAAASKPFGFMPFYPGPGIGGHCIPKDPRLLSWKVRTLHFDPRFIRLASTINEGMPGYAVKRIAQALGRTTRTLRGRRILVLGAAYKPGLGDYRESPALDVMDLLLRAGARVRYHDPFVPSLEVRGRRLSSVPLSEACLKSAHCAAILTAHPGVDYERVARLAPLVFDARNAAKGLRSPKVVRL
ncbi:MAG: nucleotide sugar dehydrogenase [Elusimicrobia bacterium]|nr:nucleotide sugar dehydrogenase [Elusimicrobiota bacterium]